jgi:hypothetical protein
MFPIGLGLKVLFGSAILTVLSLDYCCLLLVILPKKDCGPFLFNALYWLLRSTLRIGYEPGKAKSNSLLYYNADTDKASWATYDVNLDSWTKEYLGDPKPAKI